jgi:hypothetical protein
LTDFELTHKCIERNDRTSNVNWNIKHIGKIVGERIVPDRKIGGLTGFSPFLETKEFKDLNIGLAFDEGTSLDHLTQIQ